jgi:hypothetical protein
MSTRGSHPRVRRRTNSHSRQDNFSRVPWPSRGTRGRGVSSTPAHCNDKTHFYHYYSSSIHNGRAAVEEICVSEHGQRGPNSCRPHARDGISRSASVPRGRGRRTGTQEKRRVQNRCDHIEQSSKWLGLSIVDPERGASGAGSLPRHGVACPGQLASRSLTARRFNPKRRPALRRFRLHRPPRLLPHHAGLPCCAPRWAPR